VSLIKPKSFLKDLKRTENIIGDRTSECKTERFLFERQRNESERREEVKEV
jgi:hypothetical protein